MKSSKISTHLILRGKELFDAKPRYVRFTKLGPADRLVNSIRKYPHAFVIACLLDKQLKAERAWMAPYEISVRLGSFEIQELARLSKTKWAHIMSKPTPLHRFPSKMGCEIYLAVRHIVENYGGNAARIWSGNPSSAAVVYRFLEFEGIGPKVATMATNILARDFKVPMSDYFSIDLSVDTHVKRVLQRMGLVRPDASNEQIVYAARAINPEFPGLLDFPLWEIGREWCKARTPNCGQCYVQRHCPKYVEATRSKRA